MAPQHVADGPERRAGLVVADPVAALLRVPIIAKEGLEGIRGEPPWDDCHN